MPLKRSVTVERRVDLASFFCMISRHGPAVLLALVLVACFGYGFVVFRRAREKWRRRRGRRGGEEEEEEEEAECRDSCAAEEEGSEGGLEREREATTRSTDAYDENSIDDVPVRRRIPSKPRTPDRHGAMDRAQHAFFWEWNSHRTQSRAEEEKGHVPESEEEEEAAPEPTKNIHHEEDTTVDSSEDVTTTNEDVSEEDCRPEETVLFTFSSQNNSFPTPNLSSNDLNKSNYVEFEDLVTESLTSQKENENDIYKANDQTVGRVEYIGVKNVMAFDSKEENLPVTCQKREPEPSELKETRDEPRLSSDIVHSETSDTTNNTNQSLDCQPTVDGVAIQSASIDCTVVKDLAPITPCLNLLTEAFDGEISQSSLSDDAKVEIVSVTDTTEKSNGQTEHEVVSEVVIAPKMDNESGKTVKVEEVDCVDNQSPSIDLVEDLAPITPCPNLFNERFDGEISQSSLSNDAKVEIISVTDTTKPPNDQSEPLVAQNLDTEAIIAPKMDDGSGKTTQAEAVDSVENQSPSIDFKEIESSAHIVPCPNLVTEELDEEISQSSLADNAKVEIVSVTNMTEPSHDQTEHAVAQTLNTEAAIATKMVGENGKTAHEIEIETARINDKIDCIVEQIVADAYEEVKLITQEPKRLDEKTWEETKVFHQKECKEMAFCSNMAAQMRRKS
ncbi:hypothetical protein WMY93_021739 [Mugilogobius chulae]|uniref:Uncharacterized protein n=1 Tax=Mugilogobius chulae TaxID=88201 RepID=A0AAW0NG66_9GOBI